MFAVLVGGAVGLAVGNLAQADTDPPEPAMPPSVWDLGPRIQAADSTGSVVGYILRDEMRDQQLADDLAVRDYKSDQVVGHMHPQDL